jgi:hypothetical protein
MAFLFPTLDKFPPNTEFWDVEGDPVAISGGVELIPVNGGFEELPADIPDPTAPRVREVDFKEYLLLLEGVIKKLT